MPYQKNPGCRGLSLVEVLIAVVFLVFGLGGIVKLYSHQQIQVARAARVSRAERLAQGYLAHLQKAGYENLNQMYQAFEDEDKKKAYERPMQSKDDPDFQWNLELEPVTIEGIPMLYMQVKTWYMPGGKAAEGPVGNIRKEVSGYVAAR